VYFPKASHVYVTGSVARPGPYRFEEGMTVLQVLTMAGGATDRGSAGRAKLIRIVDGKKVERKAKPAEIVLPEDTLSSLSGSSDTRASGCVAFGDGPHIMWYAAISDLSHQEAHKPLILQGFSIHWRRSRRGVPI